MIPGSMGLLKDDCRQNLGFGIRIELDQSHFRCCAPFLGSLAQELANGLVTPAQIALILAGLLIRDAKQQRWDFLVQFTLQFRGEPAKLAERMPRGAVDQILESL